MARSVHVVCGEYVVQVMPCYVVDKWCCPVCEKTSGMLWKWVVIVLCRVLVASCLPFCFYHIIEEKARLTCFCYPVCNANKRGVNH